MPRLNTAVMDVATCNVEKFAYKPWGMRRNPANWTAEVVNDYPARFSRGYCMHEHLPNLGLINMGGRVYNARTNQFISPDPYRQAPDSWLNCNRFGYCMGNPVMYTDPTGEDYLSDLMADWSLFNNNILTNIYNTGTLNYDYGSYTGISNSSGPSSTYYVTTTITTQPYTYTPDPITTPNMTAVFNSINSTMKNIGSMLNNIWDDISSSCSNLFSQTTSTTYSTGRYNADQEAGYVIMGPGYATPFSDSYNSSTANYVYGCEDFSWFPTSLSTTGGVSANKWKRIGDYATYAKESVNRGISLFGESTSPGLVREHVATSHQINEKHVTKYGSVYFYSAYDTLEIYNNEIGVIQWRDTIIHPAR